MRPLFRRLVALALASPTLAHASTDGAWVQLATPLQFIPPYSGAAVVMDTRRGRLIESGGTWSSTGVVESPSEIWSFALRDTSKWTSLGSAPAASTPNGVSYAGAVYDSLADCVYLFGGAHVGGGRFSNFSDMLWRLDLAQAPRSWQPVAVPGTRPPGRKGHVLAFDPVLRRLVLFAGRDSTGKALADLWTLDVDAPSSWAQINASGPFSREFATGGMDAAHGRFIVVGGLSNTGMARSDSWAFDFAAGLWSNMGATGGPQGALTGAIDAARDRLLVNAVADSLVSWELSLGFASQWRRLTPAGFAPHVSASRFSAVFDPGSDCLVHANGAWISLPNYQRVVVLHALHFSPLPLVTVTTSTTVSHVQGNSVLDVAITADRPLYGPIVLDQVEPGPVARYYRDRPAPVGGMSLALPTLAPGTHYDFRLAWFDGAEVRSTPIPIDTPPAPVHLDVTLDHYRAYGSMLDVAWSVPNDSAGWLARIMPERRVDSGPWTPTYATYPNAGMVAVIMSNYPVGDTVSFRLRWGPTLTEYASEPATLVTPIPRLIAAGGNRAAAVAEFRVAAGMPFVVTLHESSKSMPNPVGQNVTPTPDGLLHVEDPSGGGPDASYILAWDVNGADRYSDPFDIVVSTQDVDLLQSVHVDSTEVSFNWSDPEPDWSSPLVLERTQGVAEWDSLQVLPPGLPSEQRVVVDATVEAGLAYRYRLRWPQQGLSYVHSLPLNVTIPGTPPDTTQTPPQLALAFGAALANPMRGILALPVTTPAGEAATLELFDASGRRVHRRELAPSWSGTVSLEGLRGGMYFARLATSTAVRLRKVVLLP